LRFLEARARSVAEVRRRLSGAGYRDELVQDAITRLGELGMLDDAAFAAAWVESRDRARPRGSIALRRELRLKGIDPGTIAATLDERAGTDPANGEREDPDEIAARRVLERHAAALARITDPRRRRQRAWALLARHGFEGEMCARLAAGVTADAEGEA
jgi:regulatory protein